LSRSDIRVQYIKSSFTAISRWFRSVVELAYYAQMLSNNLEGDRRPETPHPAKEAGCSLKPAVVEDATAAHMGSWIQLRAVKRMMFSYHGGRAGTRSRSTREENAEQRQQRMVAVAGEDIQAGQARRSFVA
jgi:hypothetical protein